MINRYVLGFLLIVLLPLAGISQSGYRLVPYYPWSASLNLGTNSFHSLSDSVKANKVPGTSVSLRLSYFIVHGIELGGELQTGLLKADNNIKDPAQLSRLRYAKNNYYMGNLGIRVYPAQFFQTAEDLRVEHRASLGKKILNRAYAGVSFGAMYNRQLDVDKEYEDTGGVPISTNFSAHPSGYTFVGSANLGFNVPLSSLNPRDLDMAVWSLNFNAQFNRGMFANRSIIDGWPDNSFDAFGVYSIGLHVAF